MIHAGSSKHGWYADATGTMDHHHAQHTVPHTPALTRTTCPTEPLTCLTHPSAPAPTGPTCCPAPGVPPAQTSTSSRPLPRGCATARARAHQIPTAPAAPCSTAPSAQARQQQAAAWPSHRQRARRAACSWRGTTPALRCRCCAANGLAGWSSATASPARQRQVGGRVKQSRQAAAGGVAVAMQSVLMQPIGVFWGVAGSALPVSPHFASGMLCMQWGQMMGTDVLAQCVASCALQPLAPPALCPLQAASTWLS